MSVRVSAYTKDKEVTTSDTGIKSGSFLLFENFQLPICFQKTIDNHSD